MKKQNQNFQYIKVKLEDNIFNLSELKKHIKEAISEFLDKQEFLDKKQKKLIH